MKILANENIPLTSVRELRAVGHDVMSISERTPGIDDLSVIRLARNENRILVTFDKDYGELVYGRGLPSPPAIVYLRFIPATPLEPAEVLKALFAKGDLAVNGYFIVLNRENMRRRPLP